MSAENFLDPAPHRIAVFRALQLGDMLCVVPALRALRVAAPDAQITLIGLPWSVTFAERFNQYIDDVLVFPGFPGLPEENFDVARIPQFFIDAQRREFDIAIQLHGSGAISNLIITLLAAKKCAGFYSPGAYYPKAGTFIPWQGNETEHKTEIGRCLCLMESLGAAPQGDYLEFPLLASDFRALHTIFDSYHLTAQQYVCVHPGARLPSRRWPAERFAKVADAVAAKGIPVVLTGSQEEVDIVQNVAKAMKYPVIDLAGKTKLGVVAALIAKSRLLICNDTGVSHIAAALKTPSVVISCGADPARWAPLDKQRHHVIFQQTPCRPCTHVSCPIEHPCALEVSVTTVLIEVKRLIEQSFAEELRYAA